MKIQKIETKRIWIDDDFYVDVTPSVSDRKYSDFWLYKKDYGIAEFLIGCEVKDEDEMIGIAEYYASLSIPYFGEEEE